MYNNYLEIQWRNSTFFLNGVLALHDGRQNILVVFTQVKNLPL